MTTATASNEPAGDEPRTLDEHVIRLGEIKTRQTELNEEYAGRDFPDDVKAEFETLQQKKLATKKTIAQLKTRIAWVQEEAENEDSTEDGATFNTARPGAVRGDDIWDLSTIRGHMGGDRDGMLSELHDRSKRAIELASFPDDRVRKEDAQTHIERLLQRDSADGELGRRILITGRPGYRKAFAKWAAGQPMSNEEQRAFTLGTTGIPIPYILDPTVIPVSSSVVNPLRAISNVEQIVGSNEWRGVTAAAITAARASEVTEASDNTPTLAQPTIVCSKVQAFVPFSIESQQDWSSLEANMGRLFADAKDDEEATAFATGNGTPPNPFGVLTGATGTTAAATGLTVTAANLYSLEGALAPRFRPRAQFVANRAIYNIIRALDTAGGAQLWLRIGELMGNAPASDGGKGNTGLRLLGYPVNELSTMSATVVNTTKIMLLGDFSMFKIIDRVGMDVELIPHLFGATSRYPTGQRGLYAYWRNGSKVIDAVGFRALTGTT
jgi:HK97 family phage major capsid protein